MPQIATARELFGTVTVAEQHDWLMTRGSTRQRMAALGVQRGQIGEPGDIDAAAAPALAYVNQGRWVVDCPQPRCGGALALVRGARGFMCGQCLNVGIGHRYRPLEWPKFHAEIEDVMAVRVLPEDVNWRLGESVEAIEDENERRGLPRSRQARGQ